MTEPPALCRPAARMATQGGVPRSKAAQAVRPRPGKEQSTWAHQQEPWWRPPLRAARVPSPVRLPGDRSRGVTAACGSSRPSLALRGRGSTPQGHPAPAPDMETGGFVDVLTVSAPPSPPGDAASGGLAKRRRTTDGDGCNAQQGAGSGEQGGVAAGAAAEPANSRKPRLVWSPPLHKRFVDAVSYLGLVTAVPKRIMEVRSGPPSSVSWVPPRRCHSPFRPPFSDAHCGMRRPAHGSS